MASLKDIKPSITELPWNEQLSIHEAIRVSRRTLKKKPIAVKKSDRKINKIIKDVSSMSLEELLRLQKELEEK